MKVKRKYNKQPNIITKSTDEMTLIEKRLMYLVINRMDTGFNIQQDLFKNIEFKIEIKDLGDKNFKRIREALQKLQKREIRLIDNLKKKEFTSVVPFPYVSYGSGYIILKMLSDVVPYFLELKNGFTQYELKAALSLTSVYSQKLYELLSRWKDKKEWEVELDELKILLNAEGYRYADFKRTCLEQAINEINVKTDLTISYIPFKNGQGNKVTDIHFKILTERALAKELIKEEMDSLKEYSPAQIAYYTRNLLMNYTFSQNQADNIMTDPGLFKKFIDLESKIANGLIKADDPTRYMAASLFKYKDKSDNNK